jgi:hypothetical protein
MIIKCFSFLSYVIIPTRRSSAEAIHLMATHALGEAGSPYLTGLLADVSCIFHVLNITCSIEITKANKN